MEKNTSALVEPEIGEATGADSQLAAGTLNERNARRAYRRSSLGQRRELDAENDHIRRILAARSNAEAELIASRGRRRGIAIAPLARAVRSARGHRSRRQTARRRSRRLSPARQSGDSPPPPELAAQAAFVDRLVAELERAGTFPSGRLPRAVVWYLAALATIELATLIAGLAR